MSKPLKISEPPVSPMLEVLSLMFDSVSVSEPSPPSMIDPPVKIELIELPAEFVLSEILLLREPWLVKS